METTKSLIGKTALVTGASRGIGRAIAERLGQMGARVSLCARDAKTLHATVAALEQDSIQAMGIPADVTSSHEVATLFAETRKTFGAIDILVNNAGIGVFSPIQELAEEDWDRVMDINLKGVFLCSKEAAPEMISRRSGHIINIASLAGKNAFAGGAVYCASKWGLLGLTQCMAEDLRAHGIRVSAICPGSVATEFSPHAGKDTSKLLQADDIAHSVAMIVTQSPQSFISEVSLRPTQKP
jgi:3-oxoacyl-[acyl-carrier protein] reductase